MSQKLPAPSEHDEQRALIDWSHMQRGMYPELDLLFAIPNGAALTYRTDGRGKRYSPQAAKLKAEGLRAGVPDLFLPVARSGFHGLFVEMKVGRNKPSEEQVAYMDALVGQGYCAVVCWSAPEAIEAIQGYLKEGKE